MLNLFPIQFLAPLAYLLLRVCLGVILLTLGYRHLRNRHALKEIFTFRFFPYGLFFAWYMGTWELIIGILFILGLFTQIAALCAIALSLKMSIMHKRFAHPLIPQRLVYILMLAISLSLFITGAGAFAIDLPL
jgi:uncharacterized membrane protein YphA (DoxX/SURF4 family)